MYDKNEAVHRHGTRQHKQWRVPESKLVIMLNSLNAQLMHLIVECISKTHRI